jgi:hypothetical protein
MTNAMAAMSIIAFLMIMLVGSAEPVDIINRNQHLHNGTHRNSQTHDGTQRNSSLEQGYRHNSPIVTIVLALALSGIGHAFAVPREFTGPVCWNPVTDLDILSHSMGPVSPSPVTDLDNMSHGMGPVSPSLGMSPIFTNPVTEHDKVDLSMSPVTEPDNLSTEMSPVNPPSVMRLVNLSTVTDLNHLSLVMGLEYQSHGLSCIDPSPARNSTSPDTTTSLAAIRLGAIPFRLPASVLQFLLGHRSHPLHQLPSQHQMLTCFYAPPLVEQVTHHGIWPETQGNSNSFGRRECRRKRREEEGKFQRKGKDDDE